MYYLNAPLLRSRLKLKSLQSEKLLKAHHHEAVALLESAGVKVGSIRKHAAKLLASGATATFLIAAPASAMVFPPPISTMPHTALVAWDNQSTIQEKLRQILPKNVEPLSSDQEFKISALFQEIYGVRAMAELDGNHLNTTYGFIGAEQHLPRFPGDNIFQHDDYQEAGITPGRGAWGYFSQKKSDLTPDLVEKEKYYVAVQTLYLSDWTTRLAYLRDWYKFRKVMVVNPKNGKAVIAVIADSGPAAWTGKQFGGSPEVMHYLESQDGKARGPVVLFFVDDPLDKVRLGPVE